MNTFDEMMSNARSLEEVAIEIDEMILDVQSIRTSAVIACDAAAFVLLAPLFEELLFELDARSSAAWGNFIRESDRAKAARNKYAAEREEALTIALAGARMLAKVRK